MGKVEQSSWKIMKSYLESITLELVILYENWRLTPGHDFGVTGWWRWWNSRCKWGKLNWNKQIGKNRWRVRKLYKDRGRTSLIVIFLRIRTPLRSLKVPIPPSLRLVHQRPSAKRHCSSADSPPVSLFPSRLSHFNYILCMIWEENIGIPLTVGSI